jgi:hypothetical protein
MASILKVDELQGIATTGDITVTSEGGAATMQLQQGLAKCFINFNGTGTIATRDSFNVASHSDDGTGLYTITFTNAFNNDDYVGSGLSRNPGVSTGGTAQFPSTSDSTQATSSVQHYTVGSGGGNADFPHNHVIIHGDLA